MSIINIGYYHFNVSYSELEHELINASGCMTCKGLKAYGA